MSEHATSIETSSPSNVKEILSKGLIPLLDLEKASIVRQLEDMSVTQAELGRLLGDAMQQSSETWHDNAPADAVNQESRALEGRAKSLLTILRNSIDISAPSNAETAITVGSHVVVQFDGDDQDTHFFLSGAVRDLELPEALSECEVVTVSSPIGSTLLGKSAGETASYTGPRDRAIIIHIRNIMHANA